MALGSNHGVIVEYTAVALMEASVFMYLCQDGYLGVERCITFSMFDFLCHLQHHHNMYTPTN